MSDRIEILGPYILEIMSTTKAKYQYFLLDLPTMITLLNSFYKNGFIKQTKMIYKSMIKKSKLQLL